VPSLDESANGSKPRTMKDRMEEHRRSPACANCHRLMDPVGLALENFDGVGAFRMREAGVRIDTATELSDGTAIAGVNELRSALLARSDRFTRTFIENLLTYALGRGLVADDMPAVRTIARRAAAGITGFRRFSRDRHQHAVPDASQDRRRRIGPLALKESRMFITKKALPGEPSCAAWA
jgi:hypothetical protein